jgi:hypothetical protein
VQGAAHRPQLHEAALLPESGGHGVRLEVLDARPERQLGRRHHLGVHADEIAHHVDQLRARHPLVEAVSPRAERDHVGPGQLHGGGS